MRIHKTYRKEELEQLTSARLDQMLHEELDKEHKNEALVLELLNILEEREAGTPAPNTHKPWQTFVERYNTEIMEEPTHSKKKPQRWLGAVAAVAAVVLMVSFIAPKAAGEENIFTLIASWTEEFFFLSDPDDCPVQNTYVFKTDHPGLQQVYDTVVELGITDPVVPMWLPDGYELAEIEIFPNHDGRKICARFTRGQDSIVLYYNLSHSSEGVELPKNAEETEIIELQNCAVSIFTNNENCTAVWNTNNVECVLTISEGKEVAIRIIKSILYGGKQ